MLGNYEPTCIVTIKIARRTTGAKDNYFIKLFILFSIGVSIIRTLIPMFTMRVEFVNSEYHHSYKCTWLIVWCYLFQSLKSLSVCCSFILFCHIVQCIIYWSTLCNSTKLHSVKIDNNYLYINHPPTPPHHKYLGCFQMA